MAADGQQIINSREEGFELPHTGAGGTGIYRISGLIVMLGAAVLLAKKKSAQ